MRIEPLTPKRLSDEAPAELVRRFPPVPRTTAPAICLRRTRSRSVRRSDHGAYGCHRPVQVTGLPQTQSRLGVDCRSSTTRGTDIDRGRRITADRTGRPRRSRCRFTFTASTSISQVGRSSTRRSRPRLRLSSNWRSGPAFLHARCDRRKDLRPNRPLLGACMHRPPVIPRKAASAPPS